MIAIQTLDHHCIRSAHATSRTNNLQGPAPHGGSQPLPLLPLLKRIGTFEVATQCVLFLHLVNPDLHIERKENSVIQAYILDMEPLTIQFSDVNASSVEERRIAVRRGI